MNQEERRGPRRILVIDIGGTSVKVKCSDGDEVRRTASGPAMGPDAMVAAVKEMTKDWQYDVIAMGYPGAVLHGKIVHEPFNLAPGWVRYDFEQAFDRPVKIMNDAGMQALGSYDGGTMLFLGLGTGLGTALIVDGLTQSLEMGHLPYKYDRTYEDYVGAKGRERLGRKAWSRAVAEVVEELLAAFEADLVVLGGGRVHELEDLPSTCRVGDNDNAFIGGVRMWRDRA